MTDHNDWLALVREDIIDPNREIIDSHHHLYNRVDRVYELPELWSDTGDGHRVTQTVFVECRAGYRQEGPEHMRPIGETEYVAAMARESAENPTQATVAGIVSRADLRHPELDAILDGHEAAGAGLFKGIRQAGAREPHPEGLTIVGGGPEGLYADERFRAGVRRLGERGLSYDTWHYHHQNRDFCELAKAAPETTLILDHFGTPLGVGRYADAREEIFAEWKEDLAAIAACENVIAKLGGLAMPDNGFGWHEADRPPTSDEFVAAQERYYDHTIECFGPHRCMFESNFPVDRRSLSYRTLWNGLKRIAAKYPETDQAAMFSGTARRIYRL